MYMCLDPPCDWNAILPSQDCAEVESASARKSSAGSGGISSGITSVLVDIGFALRLFFSDIIHRFLGSVWGKLFLGGEVGEKGGEGLCHFLGIWE